MVNGASDASKFFCIFIFFVVFVFVFFVGGVGFLRRRVVEFVGFAVVVALGGFGRGR